jgi:uncharacterized protein (DUF924 family)
MSDTPAREAPAEPSLVIAFWRAAGPKRWFAKDEAFDADFHARFLDAHFAAASRRLDAWADTALGALALVILLDQFPRNTFRGTAHMFATDPLARLFARGALAAGLDVQVEAALRPFFYMPFMHSENLTDQERSVELHGILGENQRPAKEHRDIIARFGRFPHRNPMLGRETTPEEKAFLDGGGFSG